MTRGECVAGRRGGVGNRFWKLPRRLLPLFGAVAMWLASGACSDGTVTRDSAGESASDASAGTPGAGESVMGAVPPSQTRPDVRGTRGAVSAGHPLAAAAGYEVLRNGGNAVDAAVTMAAVLAVVRPHMNGVGGDAFALILDGATGDVVGLNGSGRAGDLADLSFFRAAGYSDEIPGRGPLTVSVPGAVAAWADALDRFGTISLGQALGPAIHYAEAGFPVSKRLASDMAGAGGALNESGRDLYLSGGEPPAPGTLLRNGALARTLRAVAEGGKAGFYEGPAARSISAYLEREGGYLRESDFAAHTSTWVEPLSGQYLGHRILVMPPNTQGMAQLQILEMAKHFDLGAMDPAGADYLHTLIEVKKLAFADRNQWVADPAFVDLPLDRLLGPAYLAERAGLVDPQAAAFDVTPGFAPDRIDDTGDTVYLTAVDQWGNAVSWIQSLFNSFGSGILEPESGVVLQNRGALFSLDETHPNVVAPGKRPYHTLTPLLALRGGEGAEAGPGSSAGGLAFTLGTPGGDGQTQSLTQIINDLLLFGMSPQEAVEAPRFRGYPGLEVAIEDRIPENVIAELERRGHELRVVSGWTATFGGAQMIMVEPGSGTLVVASDPRREAYGLAY